MEDKVYQYTVSAIFSIATAIRLARFFTRNPVLVQRMRDLLRILADLPAELYAEYDRSDVWPGLRDALVSKNGVLTSESDSKIYWVFCSLCYTSLMLGRV